MRLYAYWMIEGDGNGEFDLTLPCRNLWQPTRWASSASSAQSPPPWPSPLAPSCTPGRTPRSPSLTPSKLQRRSHQWRYHYCTHSLSLSRVTRSWWCIPVEVMTDLMSACLARASMHSSLLMRKRRHCSIRCCTWRPCTNNNGEWDESSVRIKRILWCAAALN